MGVASIPDHKDQRECDEWMVLRPSQKMEVVKNALDDFVTVVSVGTQPATENFVTVLSIGKKDEEQPTAQSPGPPPGGIDGHLEEEVEVFRLPGERLGFGLKFEGGNKTSERVRRLFVQSCAEQSPASRAKCSWGALGEGDEILSIDAVPVTHMTRLDCVGRLKESQLVIRLMVRCRGALRPEVVSAERKSSTEKSKVPPELPLAPPPVPPRKLRQPRGLADGEANPSPVKKCWDSPKTQSLSSSPSSQNGVRVSSSSSKSASYESCNSSPKSNLSSKQESPKGSPNDRSPDLARTKQIPEPPEAMVYLDARSQDASSTHGSASDDTGSSMSTVVDRFSTSDRFSTVSTASSTTSEQQGECVKIDQTSDHYEDASPAKEPARNARLDSELARVPLEQLELEFSANPPDYLLSRLANSEAVTYVESRGDVERVTAVVAPNTVLIEETITLQPPLSFQDAPLSYGHEARPGIFYAVDLATDSTTHFRPIKDDAAIVECVNGDNDEYRDAAKVVAPPLPIRNHINRIPINQTDDVELNKDANAPVLPPKPLPRKDIKAKRKRPPPPPPPPVTAPRREMPPLPPRTVSSSSSESSPVKESQNPPNMGNKRNSEPIDKNSSSSFEKTEIQSAAEPSEKKDKETEEVEQDKEGEKTNKVLEIIEMKKAKAFNEKSERKAKESLEKRTDEIMESTNRRRKSLLELGYMNTESVETEASEEDGSEIERIGFGENLESCRKDIGADEGGNLETVRSNRKDAVEAYQDSGKKEPIQEKERGETYECSDEIKEDSKSFDVEGDEKSTDDRFDEEDDDTTDESDEDNYYWQSNLATIGEEEENNSLEYNNANGDLHGAKLSPVESKEITPATEDLKSVDNKCQKDEIVDLSESPEDAKREADQNHPVTNSVDGRMDNCGGGQRLPPDGDEFPASYQEFNTVEQYQCITTTRNTTMTTNGTLESQAFVTNESFKMVPGEGSSNGMTTAERTVIASKSVLLPDNRVIVQTVVDDVKETNLLPGTAPIKCYPACEESPKGPVFANTFSKSNATVVSEKKIEISGYPQILDSDGQKDLETSSPPPLPLTNPPKNDLVVSLNRTVPADSQRKFSLNSELRRQDDKSEKSVRDKIAMFSSQSSLEAPLFPSVITVSVATTTGRRLSKYKSSEDVFAEEKSPKEKSSTFGKRTQSSFDLTDSAKYCPRPSLPANSPPSSTTLDVRNSPKSVTVPSCQNSFDSKSNSPSMKPLVSSTTSFYPTIKSFQSPISSPIAKPANAPSLTRATSFSGASNNYSHERPQSSSEILANNQVARTNSLASTFRRPSEEMRRTSLNQLIEQRRKSMSKLRGLVIPERDAVPVEQPIVDLPEIKSRDSILLQQIPKSNIYDKWGSQSSLASNASTASMPLKATTSFKMPAPQIHSKYSPAFKRKSLSVCGSTPSSSALKPSQTDPPKSLESICSPTRSDYSFEFVSSSGSPETPRSKPRTLPKKSRADYDDSDNDSAVSSSQSSISRGFSPPMSPVPSERSTVSSERSYVPSETNYSRQLIIESSMRNFGNDRQPFTAKSNNFSERNYVDGSSSNGSSPDARSPQPGDPNPRNSQIPQRQSLKRSNSTDTNCSTSSTLTSGSQASTESISRRVLKPQSVEAINRKNILASARCRSGRDLNGSPLIQRKFSDEENVQEKSGSYRATNGTSKSLPSKPDIKIAYIEVTDTFVGDDDEDDVDNELNEKKFDDPKKPVKRTTIPQPTSEQQKSEIVLETSNDLKMWVRSEAMALMNQEKSNGEKPSSSVILEKTKPNHPGIIEANPSQEVGKAKPRKDEEDQSDLLSVLQTRSRTRSAIHVEDAPFGGSKSQMSLEDLLGGKAETKKIRPQGPNAEKNGRVLANETRRKAPGDSPMETKGFASKIPTLGRVKSETQEEYEVLEKSSKPVSKIPTASKSLGRRSVSVNDMKKALERNESVPGVHNNHATAPVGTHNRFLSLDSSVEEPISPVGTDERYCREQFGSISSLASSTSLISQHELAQLVEEASLEEARGAHEVIVVLLHKENPAGSVGITLAGGVDCEVKEITVHRVLTHSIADKDGRVQRGDRILSINGRSTRGLTHRESLAVLKQPRSEVVLVVSRSRLEDAGCKLRSRTESVETIVEGFETNSGLEDTAWGPPSTVAIYKDGAGLGFSLEGGRDSPLGDRPLVIKKIFTGGAAEKTGALRAGDQLLEVNGNDVTRMSRIEAWSLMKKLHDGEVNLLVRHPATKSS